MGTWVLYVDESGDCHSHSVPLLSGQTPLFAVSGVALPLSQWRLVDREYLRLKRRFFRNEIEESTRSTGKRAEIWEAKGNSLTAPRNRDSYACHYQRYCADVPGAADYTHVRGYYWRLIQALQWRGRTSQDARGKYGFSVFRRMPDQGADMETLL